MKWSRREFLRTAALGGAALMLGGRSRADLTNAGQPPNIVIIYADDLGYGDVGCYGATKVKTPNIDRLAREGRLFTDAHSASAVCTPSRYCLLTGKYAWRVKSWGPIFLKGAALIADGQLTVPKLLKRHGYATACIGKWHLGFGEKAPDWNGELKPGPLEAGFDTYFGMPTVSSHPPHVYVEGHRVVGLDPADPFVMGGNEATQPYPEKHTDGIHGGKAAFALYKDEEVMTTLKERAVEWIEAHRAGPFFLYLATTAIHHPFTPAPRFRGTSQCGPYGDYIHELDWVAGEVLGTLDKLGLAENTLVMFTSDNGGMLNGGGREAWKAGHRLNGDLLGFKFGAWEGGHRVPCLIRWPGRVPAGSRSNEMIAHVDVLATVAAIMGDTLGAEDAPDSFNVLAAWTGTPEKPIRDHLIVAPNKPANLAIRAGEWVYIGARGSGGFGNGLAELAFTGEVNSDVTKNGKIKPGAPKAQLYNLKDDPKQSRNVIREHPEVAERLRKMLEGYRAAGRSAPVKQD